MIDVLTEEAVFRSWVIRPPVKSNFREGGTNGYVARRGIEYFSSWTR